MIEAMGEADITPLGELALRYFVILGGLIVAIFATNDWVIGLLLGTYFVTNCSYNLLLRPRKLQPTLQSYLLLVSLFVTNTTVFSVCAAYMFSYDQLAMSTLGLAGGVAQGMYNLARHRRFSFLAFWDTFLVVALAFFCGLRHLGEMETIAEQGVLILSSFGVASYFIYAQFKSIQIHVSLRDARVETIQTQKMRAVGQLTAGVAHDFNNLLTVIRGNIELAELNKIDRETRERLSDAKIGADQAADLVAQLLAFSRKAQLQADLVLMKPFLNEFQRILKRLLPASIDVKVLLDEKLDHVFCDANLFQSSLLNLVINARDAMKEAGTITLQCKIASKADIAMSSLDLAASSSIGLIRVSDTGPGIPREIMQNVTEPFFTTKSVGDGSGLGLSSAKGFAEQSGGGIHIDNSKNSGAAITLFLPIDPPA